MQEKAMTFVGGGGKSKDGWNQHKNTRMFKFQVAVPENRRKTKTNVGGNFYNQQTNKLWQTISGFPCWRILTTAHESVWQYNRIKNGFPYSNHIDYFEIVYFSCCYCFVVIFEWRLKFWKTKNMSVFSAAVLCAVSFISCLQASKLYTLLITSGR